MIKGPIKKDVVSINIYATNIETPKYITILIELKGETDRNTVSVGHSNIPLKSMNISSRQKI